MSKTKQVFLGMVGVFIALYLILAGLKLYDIQTHKNQLENSFSRAVEQTLESGYGLEDESAVRQMLEQNIADSLSEDGELIISVRAVDLKKGLLSVSVTESFTLITGETHTITLEKTAIMERLMVDEPKVTIRFMVDGEIYKECQLAQGEVCPMPTVPVDYFKGWKEYGTKESELIQEIGSVWKDTIYIAVFN